MPCPCGSTRCVCEDGCLCRDIRCGCSKCEFLQKVCPQCNLPFYVIMRTEDDYGRQVCSCDFYSGAHVNVDTQESASNLPASLRKDNCPRCGLPFVTGAKSENYKRTVKSCRHCCKTLDTNSPEVPTEHETSNCTSDQRDVSGDRQIRKVQSRKSRNLKSTWQAKKVKEHSSNSAEEFSDVELSGARALLAASSNPFPSQDNAAQNVPCIGPENKGDSITQLQTGIFSRSHNTSLGSLSLQGNTSGVSSPCTPEGIRYFQSLGLVPLNQAFRPQLPQPFPRFPDPIPGPPAFGGPSGFFPYHHLTRNPFFYRPPPILSQEAIARSERMEKWFGTLEDVINTTGQLPDAETAASLDREDKERLKQQSMDEEETSSETGGKLAKRPKSGGKRQSYDSQLTIKKKGEKQDVTTRTTDSETSSTLSNTHKESETD